MSSGNRATAETTDAPDPDDSGVRRSDIPARHVTISMGDYAIEPIWTKDDLTEEERLLWDQALQEDRWVTGDVVTAEIATRCSRGT